MKMVKNSQDQINTPETSTSPTSVGLSTQWRESDLKCFFLEHQEVTDQKINTLGKVLTYFEDMDTEIKEYDGQEKPKAVFVLVFNEGQYIRDKLTRICDAFQAKQFPMGNIWNQQSLMEEIVKVSKQISDTNTMLKTTKSEMRLYLKEINKIPHSATSLIEVYKWFVIQQRSVY